MVDLTYAPFVDVEEKKREIAYLLWEEEGRPEGMAEQHWEKACLIVMNLDSSDQEGTQPEWLVKQETAPPIAEQIVEQNNVPVQESPIEAIRRRINGRSAA